MTGWWVVYCLVVLGGVLVACLAGVALSVVAYRQARAAARIRPEDAASVPGVDAASVPEVDPAPWIALLERLLADPDTKCDPSLDGRSFTIRLAAGGTVAVDTYSATKQPAVCVWRLDGTLQCVVPIPQALFDRVAAHRGEQSAPDIAPETASAASSAKGETP